MPEVVLYSPEHHSWMRYLRPLATFCIHEHTQITPLLENLEREVETNGLHAAGFLSYEAGGAFDRAMPAQASTFPWPGSASSPRLNRSRLMPEFSPVSTGAQTWTRQPMPVRYSRFATPSLRAKRIRSITPIDNAPRGMAIPGLRSVLWRIANPPHTTPLSTRTHTRSAAPRQKLFLA